MTTLGDLAWESWGQYGYCVFPCGADKRPLEKGGFHTAVRGQLAIKELFDRFPNAALIGVPAGLNNLIVIDVDTYKGEDPDGDDMTRTGSELLFRHKNVQYKLIVRSED